MILYLAAFLVGLTVGCFGGYTLEHSKVLAMQLSISELQTKAANELAEANAKIAKATEQAYQFNTQLETSHVQSLTTINALHADLARTRLFKPAINRCDSARVSKGDSTAVTTNQTEDITVPIGFENFLKQQFYEAEKLNPWIDEAYEFINNNCGIK